MRGFLYIYIYIFFYEVSVDEENIKHVHGWRGRGDTKKGANSDTRVQHQPYMSGLSRQGLLQTLFTPILMLLEKNVPCEKMKHGRGGEGRKRRSGVFAPTHIAEPTHQHARQVRRSAIILRHCSSCRRLFKICRPFALSFLRHVRTVTGEM